MSLRSRPSSCGITGSLGESPCIQLFLSLGRRLKLTDSRRSLNSNVGWTAGPPTKDNVLEIDSISEWYTTA
jgi:hypothetical protein